MNRRNFIKAFSIFSVITVISPNLYSQPMPVKVDKSGFCSSLVERKSHGFPIKGDTYMDAITDKLWVYDGKRWILMEADCGEGAVEKDDKQ